MDTIFIRELRADAWIGIYEWEKLKPQKLLHNLCLIQIKPWFGLI